MSSYSILCFKHATELPGLSGGIYFSLELYLLGLYILVMDRRLYEAVRNRNEVADIKRKYLTSEISRDEAKALAQPIIDRINYTVLIKTKEFNQKYGTHRKPYKTTFTTLMR